MLAAALVTSLSIRFGDEVTECDQFGAFGWRNVRLFILRKHGEQEERHVTRAVEMDHAVSPLLPAPVRAKRTFLNPPPRPMPASGSVASAEISSALSSSGMPAERDLRINSGVSTTVSIDIDASIYTSLTHKSMT